MKKFKEFEMEESKIANDHLNRIRGGAAAGSTRCIKDENSDSDGDGVADDCTYHMDDKGISLPSPVV